MLRVARALRQHGVVRARCEEFDPAELAGTVEESMEDPDTKEKVILTAADPFAGLHKLMAALEATVGKSSLDRKGELRTMYYQEIKRNAGERISSFCTRFRTLAADLKREGIVMPEEELGWMLKERLGLDPIRKQLLETALAGRETYETVETECLRLFRDLHTSDPLYKVKPHTDKAPLLQRFLQSHNSSSSYRTPSSATPSMRSYRTQSSSTSSRPPFRRFPNSGPPPRQALVIEPQDDEFNGHELEEEAELIPADEAESSPVPQSLEEVLQAEAECLASEIQELEEQGCEPAMLDDLESGLEQAAESLVTMREARSRIAEVKKDRGYGKASSYAPKTKPHGNQVPRQKANTKCFDCGEPGHWAGDAACSKPGAGLGKPKGRGKGIGPPPAAKQVRVTETLNTEHLPEEPLLDEASTGHEVLMVTTDTFQLPLSEVLAQSNELVAPNPRLASDKRFVGALDSACNRTCAGSSWLRWYLESLKEAPQAVQDLVLQVPEDELFRFGNGGAKKSNVRYRLPMMVGSTLIVVWVSIVPVASLGLLLGRDFLSGIGAVMSFARKKLRADLVNGGELLDMGQLAAGHFTLPMRPTTSWKCPGTQRWRSFGQDGVVEMQLSSLEWWQKRLQFRLSHFEDVAPPSTTSHEHLVTESSMSAMAQAMKVAQTPPVISSTSPTTSRRPTTSDQGPDGLSSDRARHDRRDLSHDRAMAAHDFAPARQGRLARPWIALVVAAAASAALCTVPLSKHSACQAMGRPSGRHDPPATKGYHALSLATRSSEPGLHRKEPAGTWPVSQSSGPAVRLHGGRFASRNACSKGQQGGSLSVEERGHSRGSARSQDPVAEGRTRRSSSTVDWTERRPAIFEGRPCTSRHSSTGPSRAQDDHRAAETRLQASSERVDAEAQVPHGRNQFHRPSNDRSQGQAKAFNSTASYGSRSSFGRSAVTLSAGRSRVDGSSRSEVPDDAQPGPAACDDSAGSQGLVRTSDVVRIGPSRCRDAGGRIWLVASGDPADERRLLPGRPRVEKRQWDSAQGSLSDLASNPWRLHQDVKPGQAQLISQAWDQHCRDRRLVSLSAKEVKEIYEMDWDDCLTKAQKDVFVTSVLLGSNEALFSENEALVNAEVPENDKRNPNVNKFKNDSGKFVKPKSLVGEVYTTTERVTKAAKHRGHVTGTPLSFETGWNFLRSLDREVARKLLAKEVPFFLVIAFPCSFWSILLNLNPPKDYERRLKEALTLLRFALQLARDQRARGHHFVLENPQSSRAWTLEEMKKALHELEARLIDFHQCRFQLRGQGGNLIRKATRIATSSDHVVQQLDGMKCLGDHWHEHVIGGKHISEPAGHYPWELAKTLVRGMEKQFEADFKQPHSTMAVEGEDPDQDEAPLADLDDSDTDVDLPDSKSSETMEKLPVGVKHALRRLHENTGHRSGKRLARALAIAGAPANVVKGALHLRCSICDEHRAPKARRPTSLPTPKDVGDQVHIDIFEVFDLQETPCLLDGFLFWELLEPWWRIKAVNLSLMSLKSFAAATRSTCTTLRFKHLGKTALWSGAVQS